MSLDCRVPDGLTVKTNRHHLLIVLTELLFNALHFTNEGRVVMRVETAGNDLLFTIEDTGPGIPPDKADFIFEKFTKIDMFTEGLGLGLFLCRRVVREGHHHPHRQTPALGIERRAETAGGIVNATACVEAIV